jgi:hypothetical protein
VDRNLMSWGADAEDECLAATRSLITERMQQLRGDGFDVCG